MLRNRGRQPLRSHPARCPDLVANAAVPALPGATKQVVDPGAPAKLPGDGVLSGSASNHQNVQPTTPLDRPLLRLLEASSLT